MRLAFVTGTFFPSTGGAQVTLHNLASRLMERGHEVVVLVPRHRWRQVGSMRAALPYRVLALPPELGRIIAFPPALRLAAAQLGRLQRRFGFDVWTSFGAYPAGVLTAAFATRAGLPHVIRTMGSDIQLRRDLGYGDRRDPRVERLVRRWSPTASVVVSLTQSVRPDVLSLGVDPRRVEIVPCGVDVDRFQGLPVDPAAGRAAHGIPQDAFLFVSTGRNHPKKGFPVLIDAFRRLEARSERRLHLAIAGERVRELAPLVADSGERSSITLIDALGPAQGEPFEMPPRGIVELCRSADAIVVPSLLETFGNVNIEAMASGSPLITTDAPGCVDVVRNRQDGLTARAGDAASLTRCMAEILEKPELRTRLALNALQTVASQYDWSHIAQRYEEIYYRIAAQAGELASHQVQEKAVAARARRRGGVQKPRPE